MDSDERADRLLGQLQQWAMAAIERPRNEREHFIDEIAAEYYADAIKNGLTQSQAEAWRDSVDDWLHELVAVIEASGGAAGGHA